MVRGFGQWLAGPQGQHPVRVVHESLLPPGVKSEDRGWRLKRLSRSSADDRRDISPARRDWVLMLAHWLWGTNPIAKRGISNMRSLVASEGFKIRATCEDSTARGRLQDQLDMHWDLAGWDDELSPRVETLMVEGEWVYWCNPVGHRGHIEIAKIMPENVDSVLRCPRNAERLEKVLLLEPMEFCEGGKIVQKKELSLARRDPWTGDWSGEALYLGLNQLSGQTRGWSDLLVVVDWLDILDQLLYTETERVQFQRSFVWDVLVKGGTQEDVDKAIAKIRADGPPRPGEILAHNEGQIWNCICPDLKLADSVAFIKFVMLICFGGLNMPEHWFSSGGDVNKACHSEDTETLTADGWKRLDELSEHDVIGTFNPENGCLEFHPANSLHVYDYEGEMVQIQNKHLDIMVTPDHRMYGKRQRNNPAKEAYEIIQAQEMNTGRWTIPVAADWTGGVDEDFVLPATATGNSRAIYPEVQVDGDLWAEFLGYFLSEGHVHTKTDKFYLVSLAQKKPEGIGPIQACIDRLRAAGFAWKQRFDEKGGAWHWTCNDKGLNMWLRENCGTYSKNKYFPAIVAGWTKRRLRIFFDALMLGDGSYDRRYGHNGKCYYTSSVQMAGDFQVLCIKLGLEAKITPGCRCFRILINEIQEAQFWKTAMKRVDYKGRVYCFNVPNHLFITRRNGKVAVTHNTAAEMGTPLWALVRDRKRQVKKFIETGASIAMQRVKRAGGLAGLDPCHMTWEVVSRDPDRTAYDLVGQMLKGLGEALAVGFEQQWLSDQEAATIYRGAVAGLGLGDLAGVPASMDNVQRAAADGLEQQRPQLSLVTPLALDAGKACKQCHGPLQDRHTTGVCSWCMSRNRRQGPPGSQVA